MKVLVVLSPLGFVALEAGWMVTELGRQPWIIYHLMRTKDAVTSVPNIAVTLATMTVVYVVLAVIALWLLWRHVIASPDTKDIEQTGVLV
jgi:cytochrome d ubiquinol oxidase subunit I